MSQLEALRDLFPEAAKDVKLNLGAVLGEGSLNTDQRWGIAVACAFAARNPELSKAVLADAQGKVGEAVIDDARAAAVLMGMNNVFYRSRHMLGKESYNAIPARLRMNRIVKPQLSKADFELFCLAVSAINGCEACLKSHEKVVIEGGLTEHHVHDALRIAATIHAAAVALEIALH